MATTESDVLAERIERLEASLREVERRLAEIEGVRPQVSEEPEEPSGIDFVLIGKSVLIVGGAYLLRALTELNLVPDRWGIVLGFAYAVAWMLVADRAMRRGRRMVAFFDAGTAAVIAAGIIFESTARFHAFPPVVASILTVAAAVVLRRFRVTAAVMTTIALTGVSIATGDLLWPTLAAAAIGALVVRGPIVAVASDLLAAVLIVLTAVGRTPHSMWMVEAALLAFAALWIASRDPIQSAVAILLGAGGASAFALTPTALAAIWGAAAVGAAALGRRWAPCGWIAPLWALAATVAAFLAHGPMLPIVGVLTAVALVVAARVRLALLCISTVLALASVETLLVAGDPAVLAMERSIVLAVAAVVLSLLPIAEGATVSRLVLIFGAIKLVAEDMRAGRATMIVVALAAYGLAMLVIARRRAGAP